MNDLTKRAFEGLIFFLVFLAVVIFLPASTINFWQGWLYWTVFSISCLVITLYFLKKDPALIERRLRAGPGAEKESTQKRIQTITSVLFIVLLIFPGIDHQQHWSQVPPAMVVMSDLIVALGFFIVFLVFKQNTFTSATIELAEKQKVISTGPYAIVRHPMYSGALLLLLFTPIGLGSWWGIIVGVLLCLMIVVRLLDEEKFLKKNLSGYTEYCRKVKFRLIPFVW